MTNLERRIRWSRIACALFTVAALCESAVFGLNLATGQRLLALLYAIAAVCFAASAVLHAVIVRRLRRQVTS